MCCSLSEMLIRSVASTMVLLTVKIIKAALNAL